MSELQSNEFEKEDIESGKLTFEDVMESLGLPHNATNEVIQKKLDELRGREPQRPDEMAA